MSSYRTAASTSASASPSRATAEVLIVAPPDRVASCLVPEVGAYLERELPKVIAEQQEALVRRLPRDMMLAACMCFPVPANTPVGYTFRTSMDTDPWHAFRQKVVSAGSRASTMQILQAAQSSSLVRFQLSTDAYPRADAVEQFARRLSDTIASLMERQAPGASVTLLQHKTPRPRHYETVAASASGRAAEVTTVFEDRTDRGEWLQQAFDGVQYNRTVAVNEARTVARQLGAGLIAFKEARELQQQDRLQGRSFDVVHRERLDPWMTLLAENPRLLDNELADVFARIDAFYPDRLARPATSNLVTLATRRQKSRPRF